LQGFGAAFLQALHRRQRHRLHQPVRVPAERVRQLCCRASSRNQLDTRYGDVGARDGVVAREADGRAAPWVVRAADVPVRDADDAHGGALVGAPSAVLDVLHGHAGELDGRHGAGAALPRLDLDAIVGVDDARVPDRDVGHAGVRVGHAQAADAAGGTPRRALSLRQAHATTTTTTGLLLPSANNGTDEYLMPCPWLHVTFWMWTPEPMETQSSPASWTYLSLSLSDVNTTGAFLAESD
jgi:hypothetical protein